MISHLESGQIHHQKTTLNDRTKFIELRRLYIINELIDEKDR